MTGQNHCLYPIHQTLFIVVSMQTRNTRGVFIQILMTRTLDSVTGSNLKRWLQGDNLFRSQVVQATAQTQAKAARPISRVASLTYKPSGD